MSFEKLFCGLGFYKKDSDSDKSAVGFNKGGKKTMDMKSTL